MVQLVGIAGSLRKQSYNRALLNAAAAQLPAAHRISIADITDFPLYSEDIENEAGIPASVAAVKAAISAADGILIATPEYNHSIPGVLKNALDWISRPPQDQARVLHGKPVALIGATIGNFGTAFAQDAWLPIFRALKMQLWGDGGPFYLMRAGEAFGPDGQLRDADAVKRLTAYITGFATACEHMQAGEK
ncbi:MAG TPA: NADPH-dependent FMN reductase [Alphaproteobacteria bacterium]|nr:NADPH-dependent FMN reductase [Alphaproteobacteria bacterium]